MPEILPIIIIGTGLAGYSLAREFRKLDTDTPLLMLSRDDGHSYSKPMLSTGFTKNKTAEALSMGDPGKMATQLKVSIRNYSEVTHIDTAKKQIFIDSETLSYSKLVLANGASVNTLTFPGSEHPNVVSINDLMDYRHFRDKLDSKKHVLIMGAGLIGCEYANDLLNGDYKVTIVDPSTSALSGLIPDAAGQALIQGLTNSGAQFHMQSYVSEVAELNKHMLATLNNGIEIICDIIISAVGIKPNITLAQSAGIDCHTGVVTDTYLQTSQEDIFALGDCAEINGDIRLFVLPLMASARALAKTLSGEATAVNFGVMPVITKTPACPVIICPPSSAEGNWQVEQNGLDTECKFLNSRQELTGFVLTGTKTQEKQNMIKALHRT